MSGEFKFIDEYTPSLVRADSSERRVAARSLSGAAPDYHTHDALGAFGEYDAYFDVERDELFERLLGRNTGSATSTDNATGTDEDNVNATESYIALPSPSTIVEPFPFWMRSSAPVAELEVDHPPAAPSPLNLEEIQEEAEEVEQEAEEENVLEQQEQVSIEAFSDFSDTTPTDPAPTPSSPMHVLDEAGAVAPDHDETLESTLKATSPKSDEEPASNVQEEEENSPEERERASPATGPDSPTSTRPDSRFPSTPSDRPYDTIVYRSQTPGSARGTVAPSSEGASNLAELEKRMNSSPSGWLGNETLEELELGPKEDPADPELTPRAPSSDEISTVVEPDTKDEPIDPPLSPLTPCPPTPGPGSPESRASPEPQPPGRSQKRKRATQEDPSTSEPGLKWFSLPGRVGRPGDGVEDIPVQAESCCRYVGENGLCHFRSLDGQGMCGAELPKDAKTVRAHVNMHIDHNGWQDCADRDPTWRPTCQWCGKKRTKLEQLLRHILDTHLRIHAEICACGGTNSRANQKNNKGRHENSERHQAYLKELEEAAAKVGAGGKGKEAPRIEEAEEKNDEQPEFVEGSSRDTKRRRYR